MSNISATHGVCAACKYDPNCIYENDSDSVILQCEQFEFLCGGDDPANGIQDAVVFDARPDPALTGLCASCDNRETCIYPKPDGGVWRCEEYV